jgi:electron transfer flavoprotein alpha subunit
MSSILLIAPNCSEIEPLVSFAQKIGYDYDVMCFEPNPPSDYGARKTYYLNAGAIPADGISNALSEFCTHYDMIVGPSTMFGKDLLPRIAGTLDRPMVSDIIEVLTPKKFRRPMYADNVIATVEVECDLFVVTVRTTAFSEPTKSSPLGVEELLMNLESKVDRISVSESSGGRPDLTQASVVVSGGRPLKDPETFEKLIGGLADVLGGAIGATRAAVDSGIAPNESQVGQTGKVVAPELYIAAGVSGSTQHVAGMKDSKVIVAINTDPEAPIFEIADYGLVQDLYEAIPELITKLRS